MSKTPTYIVQGSVRGIVSRHHDILRACASLRRDKRACRNLGGGAYSDCEIVRADGEPLNQIECAAIAEFGGLHSRHRSDQYRW